MKTLTPNQRIDIYSHIFVQWIADQGLLDEWLDEVNRYYLDNPQLRHFNSANYISCFEWYDAKYYNDWKSISYSWGNKCNQIANELRLYFPKVLFRTDKYDVLSIIPERAELYR